MLHRKRFLILVFILVGVLYFLPHKNKVEAVCRITCDAAKRCSQICTEPPPRLPTDTASTKCAAYCPNGTICYQPPMPVCKAGTKCLQIMPPTKCVPQATVACYSRRMSCSNACGQTLQCADDGCGSKTCCPATEPCKSTCKPPCPQGSSCVEQAASKCPPGAYCLISAETVSVCVANTPTPILANTCPKRSQGDANCDGAINAVDYDIFKSKMSGIAYARANYSADFNSDSAVSLLDYEIWRNTLYK